VVLLLEKSKQWDLYLNQEMMYLHLQGAENYSKTCL